MKKLSFLLAVGLLTGALYTSQATAASITWAFDAVSFTLPGGNTATKISSSVGLQVMGYAYDDGNNLYTNVFLGNDFNGLGLSSATPFPSDPQSGAIDGFTYFDNTVFEYVSLDFLPIFNYINANGGISNYELSLQMNSVNGTVNGGWNTLSTALSIVQDTFTMTSSGSHLLTLTGVLLSHDRYLILYMSDIGQSSQLLSVKLTDCRVDTCTTSSTAPEPGMIGLLGFSLAGLAVLRWRK